MKIFKFSTELADHKLRKSTFPLSYCVEYQQPQHGFEDRMEANINDIGLPITNKISAKAAKIQGVKASQDVARGVCFTSLSNSLLSSKCSNVKGGAACFETFKSLKVFQAVSDYLNN